jgi:hypothetical protein
MKVSVKLLGVQISVDDFTLTWYLKVVYRVIDIYMHNTSFHLKIWWIWWIFSKDIFWGPSFFDPKNISPQKKSLIQTTSFENWKNQTWN